MGFFFPLYFLGFSKLSHLHPASWCVGQKKEGTGEKIQLPASPLYRLCPDRPGIRQPSVLLRLCPQVSEACSPSLRKEKITRVLRKHNLFLLQVLQPESTMWTQRHLQVVVENAALGGIPSPVVGWVLGSMKK